MKVSGAFEPPSGMHVDHPISGPGFVEITAGGAIGYRPAGRTLRAAGRAGVEQLRV